MPEEERLEIVSAVEDEFSEPLERFEQALDDIDDEIRQTGDGADDIRLDVQVTGVGESLAKLEALERTIERIDDAEVTVDTDHDVAAPTPAMTSGGGETPTMTSGGGETPTMTSGGRRSFGDPDEILDETGTIGGQAPSLTRHAEIGGFEDDDIELVDGFNPPTHFQGPFGAGPGTADDEVGDAIETVFGSMGDDDRSLMDRLGGGLRRRREKFPELVEDLTFTMGKFHQVIAAAIPLVGVFAGALPAAITAIGALAAGALAAAAALGGIGLLGAAGMGLQQTGELSMAPIKEELSDTLDTFVEAFSPLAKALAPTVEAAIAEIEMMAGPLADASSGLLQFRDEFMGVVDFLTTSLPPLVSDVLAFAEATAPLVGGIVETLASKDIFGFLASQLAEALPELVKIGSAVMQVLPAIVRLSQGFLTVASVIMSVLEPVFILLNTFPFLAKVIGVVAGGFLTLVAAASLYAVATTGATSVALTWASTLLGPVASAIQTTIVGVTGLEISMWGATVAAAALVGVLTLGLGPILGGLIGQFSILGDNIRGARKELDQFAKTGTALGGGPDIGGPDATPTGRGQQVYRDESVTVINAGNRDDASRQQYGNEYERRQHVDSVFGN